MTLLTIAEAAELLRVSADTLRRLHRREGLPIMRISARRYLVSEEALGEWLDSRTLRTWGDGDGAGVRSTATPG